MQMRILTGGRANANREEENKRVWDEALALCLWEIDNAKYEEHMMK